MNLSRKRSWCLHLVFPIPVFLARDWQILNGEWISKEMAIHLWISRKMAGSPTKAKSGTESDDRAAQKPLTTSCYLPTYQERAGWMAKFWPMRYKEKSAKGLLGKIFCFLKKLKRLALRVCSAFPSSFFLHWMWIWCLKLWQPSCKCEDGKVTAYGCW